MFRNIIKEQVNGSSIILINLELAVHESHFFQKNTEEVERSSFFSDPSEAPLSWCVCVCVCVCPIEIDVYVWHPTIYICISLVAP